MGVERRLCHLHGAGPRPEEGDEVEVNFTARLASKQGWFFENTYNPPVGYSLMPTMTCHIYALP